MVFFSVLLERIRNAAHKLYIEQWVHNLWVCTSQTVKTGRNFRTWTSAVWVLRSSVTTVTCSLRSFVVTFVKVMSVIVWIGKRKRKTKVKCRLWIGPGTLGKATVLVHQLEIAESTWGFSGPWLNEWMWKVEYKNWKSCYSLFDSWAHI